MKIRLIVIVIMIVLILLFLACTSYPEYESPKLDKEYGLTLNVEGVVYREYPETTWRTDIDHQERIKIGQTKSHGIYVYELDVDRIFINFKMEGFAEGAPTVWLYRKDIDMPEFSAENVDQISFSKKGNTSKTEPFDNAVTYRQTINEFFTVLEKIPEQSRVGNVPLGELYIRNSEYHSLCVIMSALAYQGDYWIGYDNGELAYAEVSQELMEKLVGEKLPPAEEFIEQYNADRD